MNLLREVVPGVPKRIMKWITKRIMDQSFLPEQRVVILQSAWPLECVLSIVLCSLLDPAPDHQDALLAERVEPGSSRRHPELCVGGMNHNDEPAPVWVTGDHKRRWTVKIPRGHQVFE
jgi:hypothetical protein